MQTLRGKLFLSGMDENAAALARKWGLGLELTDFCEARKLEEPAAMEAARARCSGIGSLWLHAPFAELSPCAIDPRVREVVMLRFRQTAQAALDDFSACLDAVQSGGKSQALTSLSYYNGSSMHALYQANETLGKAIDQLYAKLQEQAADPMKMGAVQGQYGQFNSAGTIIGTLKYNEAVYNYRNEVGGFPANVLGGLAGVKEVEPFA